MPPARAATEGIIGESSASPSTSAYVRPSVVLPKAATIEYAMRLPRPDLIKPPASQYAIAISQLWLCFWGEERGRVCVEGAGWLRGTAERRDLAARVGADAAALRTQEKKTRAAPPKKNQQLTGSRSRRR